MSYFPALLLPPSGMSLQHILWASISCISLGWQSWNWYFTYPVKQAPSPSSCHVNQTNHFTFSSVPKWKCQGENGGEIKLVLLTLSKLPRSAGWHVALSLGVFLLHLQLHDSQRHYPPPKSLPLKSWLEERKLPKTEQSVQLEGRGAEEHYLPCCCPWASHRTEKSSHCR